MAPNNWNDATDRQLLLIMIHLAVPQLPKWDNVAELMGDNFTAEAVRQHFQKLRKASVALYGPLGSSTGTPTPAGTPRKAKVNANVEIPSKSKSKRKAMTENTDGDDKESYSPSKKQAVKMEKTEEQEDSVLSPFH